jgi:hypothetical protein
MSKSSLQWRAAADAEGQYGCQAEEACIGQQLSVWPSQGNNSIYGNPPPHCEAVSEPAGTACFSAVRSTADSESDTTFILTMASQNFAQVVHFGCEIIGRLSLPRQMPTIPRLRSQRLNRRRWRPAL